MEGKTIKEKQYREKNMYLKKIHWLLWHWHCQTHEDKSSFKIHIFNDSLILWRAAHGCPARNGRRGLAETL